MIEFEHSIFIDRPPQDVFDYMNTPANAAIWQNGSEAGEWTSEAPYGIGSTYRAVTKFLGRRFEADLEVTRWDPPTRSASKAISGPVPFENDLTYQAQGDGTLLKNKIQIEFGGIFKIAEGLVAKQLEKSVESDLSTLKLLLEAG